MLLSREELRQFALKYVHSFSKYSVHRRTKERTDGRTKGHVENIMRPANLD